MRTHFPKKMDHGARVWLAKTARANYWRMASWYELEDLLQDGAMHYQRIVNRYPDITSRAHLMRLFQITFLNHLHDLAKKRTGEADVLATYERERQENIEPDASSFLAAVAKAPPAVRAFLKNLAKDAGAKILRQPPRVRMSGQEETLNERLCRIAGVDPSTIDLPQTLKEQFS